MENNLNQNKTAKEGFTLSNVLFILKSRLWIIIAIIVLFTAIGEIYSYLIKPKYTVTQKLNYQCTNLNNNSVDITGDINTMRAYGDSIIDLFDEGVVTDRANFYYKSFLNENFSNSIKVDEYIQKLKKEEIYQMEEYIKSPSYYIGKSNINTSSLAEETETNFTFHVSYTADTAQEAKDKLAILIYAFEKECAETRRVGTEDRVKYFGEFEVSISNLGLEGVSTDFSRRSTIIKFFLAGVVASLIVVIAIQLMDTSVKSKEELEKITGVSTVALIEKGE